MIQRTKRGNRILSEFEFETVKTPSWISFFVNWAGQEANTRNVLPQYVPPGSSRIVRIPANTDTNANYVLLSGDETEFDNRYHFVAPEQQTHRIMYLGTAEDDDPEGLRHYLSRAVFETPVRKVTVEDKEAFQTDMPTMTLVADPVDSSTSEIIDQVLTDGGMVVFTAYDKERTESFSRWIGGEFDDATIRRNAKYNLFAEIDFQHQLFATFNSPRYNDFTKIKFWQHATIQLNEETENQIIARFDDESPAIWSRNVGGGRVLVFSFGWTPEQSRLAFARKFLPFMDNLLKMAVNQPEPIRSSVINKPISLLAEWKSDQIKKPNGERFALDADAELFRETDLPGVYEVLSDGQTVQQFAVNVDLGESATAQMNLEQLEALGVTTGEQTTAAELAEQMRTMKDRQLENQQKIWKWAVVAVIALLLLETFLSARKSGAAVESIETADPSVA